MYLKFRKTKPIPTSYLNVKARITPYVKSKVCLFIGLFFIFFSIESYSQIILTPAEYKRQQILWEAEKYLGMRYRSKVGKHVFDCSGYVRYLMNKIDKNVTRSSVSQIHDGKRVEDVKAARPGDILVFKGRNSKNNRPGHVGLVHHWSNDTFFTMCCR